MPPTKRPKQSERRATIANLQTKPLTGTKQQHIKGGTIPKDLPGPPGGPVPIPYPNAAEPPGKGYRHGHQGFGTRRVTTSPRAEAYTWANSPNS
jgi:hypothetical protein